MQDASSKQQTKQRNKSNHQQIGLPPHSASPSEEKQTSKQRNKNSPQISPYKKLTQTTGTSLEGPETKRKKEFNLIQRKNSAFLEDWEK